MALFFIHCSTSGACTCTFSSTQVGGESSLKLFADMIDRQACPHFDCYSFFVTSLSSLAVFIIIYFCNCSQAVIHCYDVLSGNQSIERGRKTACVCGWENCVAASFTLHCLGNK